MKKIEYKGWTAELVGKILTISLNGESREYDINEYNKGLEHKEGEEYFYIRTAKGFYYQFKFEENDFFVGDKFRDDDEFLDEFASHVFGEEV